MTQFEKKYYLDFNHNPNPICHRQDMYNSRLRSGNEESIDKLNELSRFFAAFFGYPKSSFFDFSSYSIYKLIKNISEENGICSIAASQKLSYFCYEGVMLAEKCGVQIEWVSTDNQGYLSSKSLELAKQNGAKFIICSLVDEDIFLVEDLKVLNRYFVNNEIIADVSNGLALLRGFDFKVAFFWGYKIGASKNSGIILHDRNEIEFIDRLDLDEFEYIKYIILKWQKQSQKYNRDLFIEKLKEYIRDDFDILIEMNNVLDNSFCAIFKGIKVRDLIRSLALKSIFVTNGEYCSLGLSKPSRIYNLLNRTDILSSEVLSISFESLTIEDINYLSEKIAFQYFQLKAILND